MYIVIYCSLISEAVNQDGWEAFDNGEDATARYRELLQDENLISASICRPIVSTDYT